MKFNLTYGYIVSIILLPRTILHSIFLPHRLMRKAVVSTTEEWNEEYTPIGFIMSTYIFILAWKISSIFEIPDGFDSAGLAEKLSMAVKHIAPIGLVASIFIAIYVIALSFLLMVLSRRKMDRQNSTAAVRVSFLMVIPFIFLMLVRADSWLTLHISEPEPRAKFEQLAEGGISQAEFIEIIYLAVPYWHFWVSLWPLLLSAVLFIFYAAYFIFTGWRERTVIN